MRLRSLILVSVLALACSLAAPLEAAGPKTSVRECKCSIRTPNKWYVVEYFVDNDGVEHLVTASPYEKPVDNPVPGVHFLRRKLAAGLNPTAEEFLKEVGATLPGAELVGPVPATFAKEKAAARLDVLLTWQGKSLNQRFYASVRGQEVYLVLIAWQDPADLDRLEESAQSVRF